MVLKTDYQQGDIFNANDINNTNTQINDNTIKADNALQPADNISELTNDEGFIPDAPNDGFRYARKNGVWVIINSSGGEDIPDYENCDNKPQINGVTLVGNKTATELGIEVPTALSDLENDEDFIPDAPSDNKQYARKNGTWAEVANAQEYEELCTLAQDAWALVGNYYTQTVVIQKVLSDISWVMCDSSGTDIPTSLESLVVAYAKANSNSITFCAIAEPSEPLYALVKGVE